MFFFDPRSALAAVARCARLVAGAGSLEEANGILLGHGIATELEWESTHPPPPRPDEQ